MRDKISVCMGKNCRKNGSADVFDYIDKELRKRECPILKILDDLELKIHLCEKFCGKGPLVKLGEYVFLKVDESKASKILQSFYEHDYTGLTLLSTKKLKAERH